MQTSPLIRRVHTPVQALLLLLAALHFLSACSSKHRFNKGVRHYQSKNLEKATRIFNRFQDHPVYDLAAEYYLLRMKTKRAKGLFAWAKADSAFAALAQEYDGIGKDKAAKLRAVKAGQGSVRARRVSFQRRAMAYAEHQNRVTLLDSVSHLFPQWMPKVKPNWDTVRAHVVNKHLKTTDYDVATSILNRHQDVIAPAYYHRYWKLRDNVWEYFEDKYPLCQMHRFRSDHPWHHYSKDCWFEEANRAFCANSLDSMLAFHHNYPYTALELEVLEYLEARSDDPEAARLGYASRQHLADVSIYFKTLAVLFDCSVASDTATLRRNLRAYARQYAPRVSAFALLIVGTQYYSRHNQPEQVHDLLNEMRPFFPDSSVCRVNYDFQVQKRARIDTCSSCLDKTPTPLNYHLVQGLNTDRADYSAVSWDEGQEVYLVQKSKKKRQEVMRSVRDEHDGWSVPQPVQTLSLGGKAVPLSMTADGRQILLKAGQRLYVAQRTQEDALWNYPIRLPIRVSGLGRATFAPDGKAIILSGSYGAASLSRKQTTDLYVCLLNDDGKFDPPRRLGNVINTNGNETNPYLCEDGKTLFFCSDEHPGYGKMDVFVTRRKGETWTNWTTPQNLGCQVNAIGDDYGFTWVPETGQGAYFTQSGACDKSLNIGQMDIPAFARPKQLAQLRGQLLNSKGKPVTRGQIFITLNGDDQTVRIPVSPSGRYRYKLPAQVLQAEVYADVLGYYTSRDTLHDLRTAAPGIILRDTFVLIPMAEMRKPLRVKYATFEEDKATLNDPRVYRQLRLLHRFATRMKADMRITGHTDAPNSTPLSLQRANTLQAAINERFGTTPGKISTMGKGATEPRCQGDRSTTARLCNQRMEVQFDITEEMQKSISRRNQADATSDDPTVEPLPTYEADKGKARTKRTAQQEQAETSAQKVKKPWVGKRIVRWFKKVLKKPTGKDGQTEEAEEEE